MSRRCDLPATAIVARPCSSRSRSVNTSSRLYAPSAAACGAGKNRSIGRRDEPVTRHLAADVAELHVECELATVREERLFVEAIRPGTEKRNATHAGTRLELLDRTVRPVQNVLALHFHLEGDVANRR